MDYCPAIKRNFSRSASTYDEYSSVQKKTAEELLLFSGKGLYRHILEIGCGTGNYTMLLKKAFPGSRITAMDISEAMMKRAAAKKMLVSAEFINEDDFFAADIRADLVTSNAVFHWIPDPAKYLSRCCEILKPGGMVTMSVFGPRTYSELSDAIADYTGEKALIEAAGFPEIEEWKRRMSFCFRNVCAVEKIYKERFSDLHSLLRSIKHTGTRGGYYLKPKVWTKGMLREIGAIYSGKHRGITATCQVFFVKGESCV